MFLHKVAKLWAERRPGFLQRCDSTLGCNACYEL